MVPVGFQCVGEFAAKHAGVGKGGAHGIGFVRRESIQQGTHGAAWAWNVVLAGQRGEVVSESHKTSL